MVSVELGTLAGAASTGSSRTRLRALLATLLIVATAGFVLVGGTPPARADSAPENPADVTTPPTVAGDALPTVQINGVVWTQVVVGNTVYAGGSFTTARPAGSAPGVNTVARNNLLAYDIRTGALISSFAPNLNAQVRALALSPDKTRLYVAGDFTTVNGATVRRLTAFNVATGARITSFAPTLSYAAHAVVATDTKVFVGGNFTASGSTPRSNLAAFSASTGALLDWAPQAVGGQVNALTINPSGTRVVAGGSFTSMNGSSNPGYGLALLDTTTGASLPFAVNSIARDGGIDGAITSLVTDGTYVYGSGYTFGADGGTLEGVFAASWNAGEVRWIADCHGDSYNVLERGAVVYSVGHAHYCENIGGFTQGAGTVGEYPYNRAVAFTKAPTQTVTWEPNQARYTNYAGQPAPSPLTWYPAVNSGTYTGTNQGGWSLAGNNDYVVMGGEFTKVNNVAQQGLVRFASAAIAPNKRGPSLFNDTYPLNVSSPAAGKVRIGWTTNRDLDNDYLTYRVYRDAQSAAGLVRTVSQRANYWNPYTTGYTDTVAPGSTHRYRVAVTDPFGNIANSNWVTVTAASSGTVSPYLAAVYDSQPTDFWRLGGSGATTARDHAGFRDLTLGTGVTSGTPGAIAGDADTAATFSGTSTGFAATSFQESPPDEFTLEAWFRTTTTRGGKLIGWGSANTGNSTHVDRHLYMDNAGHLLFGVKPNASRLALISPGTYRDGAWHHVAASLSKAGMKLYLDGALVASRTDATVGEHLALGYWRVGGDSLSGWTSAPASAYFAGSIDEPAVYKRELTGGEIAAHFAEGKGVTPNQPPTAAFTHQSSGLLVSTNASTSSDPEGTPLSYAWTFGDGGTATGVTAAHTYATSGVYTVGLTVTDAGGVSASTSQQVTVTAPNQPPTAAFTTARAGLTISADGSTSSDPEGPIASYAWDFGDGSTGSGATVSHPYSSAGSYPVTLTVTDGAGATGTLTRTVTVGGPNEPPQPAFTVQTTPLAVDVDATGSTDDGGPIASYAWDFGDGGTATGAVAHHAYLAAGTYDVTLTVVDGDGAPATLTKSVVVASAPVAFAGDEFGRTSSSGWGTADTGGAWTVTGTATNYTVGGGVGVMRLGSAGADRQANLMSVLSNDTEVDVSLGIDKAATGGGVHLSVVGRRMPNGDVYYGKAKYNSNGTVDLILGRIVGTTETALQTRATGLTVTAGARLSLRLQVVGTSPTTLRAKLWREGTAEPATWTGSVTDSATSLQGSGGVGLRSYLSGSATNAPLVASYDHFLAGPTG